MGNPSLNHSSNLDNLYKTFDLEFSAWRADTPIPCYYSYAGTYFDEEDNLALFWDLFSDTFDGLQRAIFKNNPLSEAEYKLLYQEMTQKYGAEGTNVDPDLDYAFKNEYYPHWYIERYRLSTLPNDQNLDASFAAYAEIVESELSRWSEKKLELAKTDLENFSYFFRCQFESLIAYWIQYNDFNLDDCHKELKEQGFDLNNTVHCLYIKLVEKYTPRLI